MLQVSEYRSIIVLAACISLIFLAGLKLVISYRNAMASSQDLHRQYVSATTLVHRCNPWRLALLTGDDQAAKYELCGVQNPSHLSPVYPPSSLGFFAIILAPWAFEQLKIAWYSLNWVLWVGCVVTLVRLQPALRLSSWFIPTVLVLFCLRPVHHTVGNGQFGLLTFVGLLIGVAAVARKKPVIAALGISLMLVKPSLGIPLLGFFVLRSAWLALGLTAGLHITATCAVAFWLQQSPIQLLSEWIQVARMSLTQGSVDLTALFIALGAPANLQAPISVAYVLAVTIALLGFRDASDLRLMAIFALVSITWTYHRLYDHMLIAIPLVTLFGDLSGNMSTSKQPLGVSKTLLESRLAPNLVILASAILAVVPAKIPGLWSEATYFWLWTIFVLLLLAYSVVRVSGTDLYPHTLSKLAAQ